MAARVDRQNYVVLMASREEPQWEQTVLSLLEGRVEHYIQRGWLPTGGVSVIFEGGEIDSAYQAVYCRTEKVLL